MEVLAFVRECENIGRGEDAGMTCWFFMSYARADDKQGDEELIREFFDDLKSAVSIRVTNQSPPLAYLDQANLQPGDSWPDEIADALCSCNTFLPIMTARYFTREYCGKEWAVFEERRGKSLGTAKAPLIIPVLWVPPIEGPLPEYATDLQVTFDPKIVQQSEQRNLEDYAQYGLYHVAKRKKATHVGAYDVIVTELAKRIIQTSKAHPLPQLVQADLPSLKAAPNRFAGVHQPQPAMAAAPSRANFAIVAGNKAKMTGVRADPDNYYGNADGIEWMPYGPTDPEPIGLIAQAVATEKRLIANWMPVGPGLVKLLEQVETENSVAIMIVDPWVARHPDYQNVLEQFDKFQFRNCVVLIPWNKADASTQAARDGLLADLRKLLSRNFQGRKETYFRPEIQDRASLHGAISTALSDLEALLAPYRQPVRKTGQSDHSLPPQLQS
jgi:FxsC-like protein